ncbi:hypothetical protein LDENG_00131050 [Lucifuga dentata]|nr:hypothetical protein LDENG_00131050 [Lucifuga dentata]
MGNIISPVYSGSALWSPLQWMCSEYLPREAYRKYCDQMLEPPELAPFNTKVVPLVD